jgi:hypothetical protein
LLKALILSWSSRVTSASAFPSPSSSFDSYPLM